MRKLSFAVAVACTLLGSSAEAQVFYGLDDVFGLTENGSAAPNSAAARAAFQSNLSSSVQTETFEGFGIGISNPPLAFVGSGPTINATLTGNGVTRSSCSSGSCPINPGLADSDPRFFYLVTGVGQEFSVRFNSAVAAFGFDGSDISDSGSDFFVQFLLGGNAIAGFETPYNVTNSGDLNSSNQLFFGYINTAGFDEVRFFSNSSGDFFGFDNMTVGDARQVVGVPEPASMALLSVGLLGLATAARRRRNA